MIAREVAAPAAWARVPLREVAHLVLGKMLDKAKRTAGTPMPYLRNTNVRWHGFNLDDIYEMPFEPREIERYSAREGDVMICEGGEPGRAAVWHGPPIMFQKAIHRVRPRDSAFDPRWLVWHLQHDAATGRLAESFTGTTIKHLTGSALGRYEIVLPPITEQRRIVAKLEELFTASRAARAALSAMPSLLEQYRQSVLASAFRGELTAGWRVSNARVIGGDALLEHIDAEVAEVGRRRRAPEKTGIAPIDLPDLPDSWRWADAGRCTLRLTVGHVGPMQARYAAKGVPFLRSQNVRENRIDLTGLQHIPRDFHEDLAKSSLSPGDVVIVRSGAPGIAAVIPPDLPDANCSDLVIARFSACILPELMVRFINSRQCRERIFDRQVGVAQQHFNVGAMRTLPIPVMAREEQVELLRMIRHRETAMEVVRERTACALKELDDLTSAALGKAFRGELIPRAPVDATGSASLARFGAGGAGGSRSQRRPRASHRG